MLISIPKYIVDTGTRVGIGIRIGFDAKNIFYQHCIMNTLLRIQDIMKSWMTNTQTGMQKHVIGLRYSEEVQ